MGASSQALMPEVQFFHDKYHHVLLLNYVEKWFCKVLAAVSDTIQTFMILNKHKLLLSFINYHR